MVYWVQDTYFDHGHMIWRGAVRAVCWFTLTHYGVPEAWRAWRECSTAEVQVVVSYICCTVSALKLIGCCCLLRLPFSLVVDFWRLLVRVLQQHHLLAGSSLCSTQHFYSSTTCCCSAFNRQYLQAQPLWQAVLAGAALPASALSHSQM